LNGFGLVFCYSYRATAEAVKREIFDNAVQLYVEVMVMKTTLNSLFLCCGIVIVLTLSGCHLFFHPPGNDGEGEGEAPEGEIQTEGEYSFEGESPVEGEIVWEGESPVEGEIVREGEYPFEGESPVEGEIETEGESEFPEFTSAGEDYQYRIAPDVEYAEDEEAISGEGKNRELVEPDVIRRSDNLLYILNQYRGLTIVDLATETLLSQTPTVGFPRDLYLIDDKAYVLVSYAQTVRYEKNQFQVENGSILYLFDVSDPEEVILENKFTFDGDLVDSRLVGTILYAVCSDYSYYEADDDTPVFNTASANKSYGTTWAISVNTADPANVVLVDRVNFGGYGNLIQATNSAIFCVNNDYNTNNSIITYVDINDPDGAIRVRGAVDVPGYMADRFKMDVWDGVLRVVTNTWFPERNTLITTFDLSDPDNLIELGQALLESASGETVYATRFDQSRAYIVTYLTKDPLFVVDLSDPSNPEVSGKLEIPGWSTHIEPRGDRLIALGVDDEGGWRVMVSLFDVSNPEDPQRLDYVSFGDGWSWSSAYDDVKSLSVFDDMVLVPFSGWNGGSGGYDRLQFVSWNEQQLNTQGFVDLQGSVVRSFAWSDRYYAVTQEQLAVIDGDDIAQPVVENSLSLAENISDIVPLGEGWFAEIITRYDANDTLIKLKHLDGREGGEVELPYTGFSASFVWNQQLIISGSFWEYEPDYQSYYRVVGVDCSEVDHPLLRREWNVKLEPGWFGGRGGGYYYPMMDVMMRRYYYPYYSSTNDYAVLAGDYLVLRGYGSTFETVLGNSKPQQGLALIDLAREDSAIEYVGLGYDHVRNVRSAEGFIYISTEKVLQYLDNYYPLSACYLQVLDPVSMEITEAVNVPGTFFYKSPNSQVIVLEDSQYTNNYNVVTLLRSGELQHFEKFILRDSELMPYLSDDVKIDGNNIVYLGYAYAISYTEESGADSLIREDTIVQQEREEGYKMGVLRLTDDGRFIRGTTHNFGWIWSSLLGVKNSQAFLSVSGAAVASFDLDTDPYQMLSLTPVMGYPSTLRFSEDHAYMPLGYSGSLIVPLH